MVDKEILGTYLDPVEASLKMLYQLRFHARSSAQPLNTYFGQAENGLYASNHLHVSSMVALGSWMGSVP
jgi:hypothetical protein